MCIKYCAEGEENSKTINLKCPRNADCSTFMGNVNGKPCGARCVCLGLRKSKTNHICAYLVRICFLIYPPKIAKSRKNSSCHRNRTQGLSKWETHPVLYG